MQRLCLRINQAGQGVIGISAYLSPNSLLLNGQGNTIDHFQDLMSEWLPQRLHLRKNDYHWPPLHTPIVWQRAIPNRCAVMMHTVPGALAGAGAAGAVAGDGQNELHRPQLPRADGAMDRPSAAAVGRRLRNACRWGSRSSCTSVQSRTLCRPPSPAWPRTSKSQLATRSWTGMGLRAVSRAVRRPWLAKLLPQRSALLASTAHRADRTGGLAAGQCGKLIAEGHTSPKRKRGRMCSPRFRVGLVCAEGISCRRSGPSLRREC